MKLVVCLDENNGIKFFGKRQSQDELQRKNLFELIGNLKLFLTEYSYNLYKDIEFNFEIIDENTEIIKNSGPFLVFWKETLKDKIIKGLLARIEFPAGFYSPCKAWRAENDPAKCQR